MAWDIYAIRDRLIGLANRQDEQILPQLILELMSKDVGTLAIQAAEALADDRLYPALLQLQTWWEPTSDLEDALLACHTETTNIAD